MFRRGLCTVGLAAALAAEPSDGSAATVTWDAGGGVDDRWSNGANWTGAPDNTKPAAGDAVVFGTAGSAATLDENATCSTATLNRVGGFIISPGGGALTVLNGITRSGNSSQTSAVPIQLGGSNVWVNAAGNLVVSGGVSGSYPVAMTYSGGGSSGLILSGDNSGFTGGFSFRSAVNTDNGNKILNVTATTPNALGAGASSVDYDAAVDCAHGALSSGGSLRAGAYGQIRASGAIDANDVFVVQGLGIVSGSAAALGGLTRGANLTLSRRAVIGHQALDQATANNLGASADLLFGVSSDFSTDASRALGAGTPWLGLAAGEISAQRSITRGTLNIDTTALREFAIVGFPFYQFGSRDSVSLRLTDTAGPLAFNLVGGAPVPARVSGIVRFDASAPVYAAFTRFVVADNAMLRATRAGCFGATTPLPVDLTSGTLTADANANSTNLLISAGDLTLLGRGNVTLLAKDAVSLFAGLSISRLLRPGAGVLQVSTNTAALNSQNRFKIASAPVLRGKTGAPADQTIVDPFVVHDSGGMGDFLSYDTNGLKVATYSGTDAAVANAGEIVNQVTNTIVSGARSLYGLRFATAASSVAIAVSGGTLNLGVLSDGPPVERAPQAGLIMTSPTTVNNNTFNISSALDFGGCELCACVVNKSVNSVGLLSGPVTGTGGITKFGVGRLQLSNAANSIDGSVTIWDGTLQINGGNGLNDTAMVHVAPFGTFDLVNATNNTETLAALSGVGMVRIAAGKTLAVTGMLTAGGASGSLTVTNGGTLYLADNAVLAFDLDCVNTAAETPRLALNNSTLLLGSNVRLRINSLANRPFGSFSRTFALIGGVMSGTFAGLQTPAGTIGLLVYDAGSRTLSVRLNPAQPGVVMQFK